MEHLYVQDEDSFFIKIALEDIYYIETIKSTHYCKVVHRNGEGRIHADIKPLDRKTGGYFFKTKSSTLANIKLVWGVDTKYRILYFEKNIHCSYAARVSKELKERLPLTYFRENVKSMLYEGGDEDEQEAVASV